MCEKLKSISMSFHFLYHKVLVLISVLVICSFAQNKVLIYNFTGVDSSFSESRVFSVKLKNILEQNTVCVCDLAVDLLDSLKSLPRLCQNRECATRICETTDYSTVIWGEIGNVSETFLTSVYLVKKESDYRYLSFQDETGGGIANVLKYSIHNIGMDISGKPEKKILEAVPNEKILTSTSMLHQGIRGNEVNSTGWIKITVPSSECKVFIDGEPVGNGSCEREVLVGVHRVTAKFSDTICTELIEVFRGDVSPVVLRPVSFDDRHVRFFMGFDASWMLGSGIEFGPSHIVGLEINKNHLVALNYYWGLWVVNDCMFGGGGNYLYTFNCNDVFLTRLGGSIGFWGEQISWGESYRNYFFGGPKFRIEVGYEKVFFTIIDGTMLLGNRSLKMLLNSGISFRL